MTTAMFAFLPLLGAVLALRVNVAAVALVSLATALAVGGHAVVAGEGGALSGAVLAAVALQAGYFVGVLVAALGLARQVPVPAGHAVEARREIVVASPRPH